MPDVRRSSCAMTSAIGTDSASATATGMARSRKGNSSSSATRGPMMLPPAPNDAESVTTGAIDYSLPPGPSSMRRETPSWAMQGVVPAAPRRDARACLMAVATVGRGGVRRRVVRAVAAHRPRGLGRHGRLDRAARSGSPIGPFTPDADRGVRARARTTRGRGTHFLLLGAALVSLVGVVLAFLKANDGGPPARALLEGIGVVTIACSWVLVHTVFVLRYAHVYYTPPMGGIDFKTQRRASPTTVDFAYTAFTIGMTFQVSDTDITQRAMRRQVLRHALAVVPVRRGDPGDDRERDRRPAEHL